MSDAVPSPLPGVQPAVIITAGAAGIALAAAVAGVAPAKLALLAIGLGMGVALYHAAFGFTGAYYRAIVDRDISGIVAQCLMLALAMVLFAPFLEAGEAFGRPVTGAVAPVGWSMVFGAFIFGIGMQLGGGCASGTLFTVGGGNLRMMVVLVFFCAGCFWASLHMDWWWALPDMGAISLGAMIGWWPAVGLQMLMLAAIIVGLRLSGRRVKRPLWWDGEFNWRRLGQGPWPLFMGAGALAVLNALTLVVAGHPWSITWGFTLWAAKVAVALGWDPAGASFWVGGFQERALAASLLGDTTTIMNLGIIVGALAAAGLAGRLRPSPRMPLRSLAAAVLGGLIMGYGARLAYGCNIGAFFSGVASTSLHGWAWIVAAIAGNLVGIRLRPLFRLDG